MATVPSWGTFGSSTTSCARGAPNGSVAWRRRAQAATAVATLRRRQAALPLDGWATSSAEGAEDGVEMRVGVVAGLVEDLARVDGSDGGDVDRRRQRADAVAEGARRR